METLFTLSGAHVFPVYDAAVHAEPPVRLLDVRHEQTAAFAAEATGKLTRVPGLAVLTAGPGVTNGISAVTQAYFAGSPMVVLGGRAPAFRWGTGSLQEMDHVPVLAPVTKSAATAGADDIAATLDDAFTAARSPHRGPAFVDVSMDHLFTESTTSYAGPSLPDPVAPDPDAIAAAGRLLAAAERPVVVIGTDVWSDHAEDAARRFVEELELPTVPNGMGRGIIPGGHRLLVPKARGAAFGGCDVAVVVGAPLDFRLGYGAFADGDAAVIHLVDAATQVSSHVEPAAVAYGDLTLILDGLREAVLSAARRSDWSGWAAGLRQVHAAREDSDRALLAAEADPIHPARIYGELIPRLADDAVVIGDGGDFVSWAGRFIEPRQPGCWLDPGPFGCLGAGLGAAIAARVARPSSQVVLLLGDGAAGFSLLDVDTLVRHRLPVVMVLGNNSAWGLEKQPMQAIYGYDVIADLAPRTRYDEVVRALGGAGELVTDPAGIGPALDRAFASGVPYLVNIVTDVDAVYPRATTGV